IRVATACDTIVRVCGLSARDTVETCTPARCAICLIPDGDLLMAAKTRLWRPTPQVNAFRLRNGCARRDGNVALGAAVEAAIELRNVQVFFPCGDGDGGDAVADVVDEAASALHERIDAKQQGETRH